MNWLSNFVRPRLRALVGRSDISGDLWHRCSGCSTMIFHREFEAELRVCRHCGHHARMPAQARLSMLMDESIPIKPIDSPQTLHDPLVFRDQQRYPERLRNAQIRTGLADAMLAAYGRLGDHHVVAAILDFDFMGGSMGLAVGETFLTAARYAIKQRSALIAVTSSGGARMQEGMLSLMQLPRTVIALEEIREAGLPYIVVLADPTTGGVTASFAMLGDITLAEPGALIGFAGARVIEETMRAPLPEGFQRAEYLYEHGMIDAIVVRHEIKDTLKRILNHLSTNYPLPSLEAPSNGVSDQQVENTESEDNG